MSNSNVRLTNSVVVQALNNKADRELENSNRATEIESIANSAASAAESASTVANAANTLINTTVQEIDKDLEDQKNWVTTELETFKTNNNPKAYITETYVNGSNWYRIWSDGWKEQGGLLHNDDYTNNYVTTVTYILSYSSTEYTLVEWSGINNDASMGNFRKPYNKTATGFTYKVSTDIDGNYYCCGY